jgi:hypothetical protein
MQQVWCNYRVACRVSTAGVAGQAVQRQRDDVFGAAAGVDEDLDRSADMG